VRWIRLASKDSFYSSVSKHLVFWWRRPYRNLPGNLKYTTRLETIQTHFATCGQCLGSLLIYIYNWQYLTDPPPTIRLLTPKIVPGQAAQRPKSKGCAFLEFTHRNALQQGLKLHQSMLDGRMINVELTAGGGGRSESRLTKVRERNRALLSQRVGVLQQSSPEWSH